MRMFNQILVAGLMAQVAFTPLQATAQDTLSFFEPAPEYKPSRGLVLGSSLGATYAASMTGLYALWYKDYPRSGFHFFDDSDEWLQVDKVGHLGSAYYLGNWGIDLVKWTGLERRKAIWLGGSAGFVFLTTVEIFDAYSDQWGFSLADMLANTGGTLMAIGQELHWSEQRLKIKFSFHQSDYAKYRPGLLGETYTESLFKDYNGQTYWLSGNIHSFLPLENRFPPYLNIAIGYGADGMTGARDNNVSVLETKIPDSDRVRQFYLSPDVDLTRIQTRSRVLRSVLSVIGFIKLPAPALEYNNKGKFKWHWLYF
jgi:hypothetical protein